MKSCSTHMLNKTRHSTRLHTFVCCVISICQLVDGIHVHATILFRPLEKVRGPVLQRTSIYQTFRFVGICPVCPTCATALSSRANAPRNLLDLHSRSRYQTASASLTRPVAPSHGCSCRGCSCARERVALWNRSLWRADETSSTWSLTQRRTLSA